MAEVHTSVDALMELVKKEGKLSVPDAAKKLNTRQSTVQAWVDFLVEEHILGIEYKFTTPYIYVHDEERLERVKRDDEHYTLKDYRNGFYHKAASQDIPDERIPQMWQEHLKYVLEKQKKFFIEECERRSVTEPESLYEDYVKEVLE